MYSGNADDAALFAEYEEFGRMVGRSHDVCTRRMLQVKDIGSWSIRIHHQLEWRRTRIYKNGIGKTDVDKIVMHGEKLEVK